ncbi:DNL zinc finger-domain-containing protein [Mucidula mucida]|nr:DNL zinc finger-domain-containing protein [Mucidula mucida]
MLPSRMFRNIGVPPPLRSLIIPHASLPPNVKTLLRLRLGMVSGSKLTLHAPQTRSYSNEPTTTSQELPNKMEPRVSLTFTCTVEGCGTRSSHECSKQAYTSGIVIVECPGCKNRHLIADHLGWFKDSTDGGQMRTIEDIMRAKGEHVRRGQVNSSGDIEYYE